MSQVYLPQEDSFLLSSTLKKEIKNKKIKFLEVGSGSGIQLQILFELGIEKENIFACDINSDSVKACRKLGFNCIQSNLFENIKGKYDLILFNPPYLPEDKMEDEESKLATTGGKQGGEIINKFLTQAKKHLKKNGKIFLLTSSLTKGIDWKTYKKRILARKKLFFEELRVWELKIIS
jgi:release factor glutamine methyltransferase